MPCDSSATVSRSGHLTVFMRLRNSESSARGKFTWNGRTASLVVAACTWAGIRLEAAAATEAARILRRSGNGGFADMVVSLRSGNRTVLPLTVVCGARLRIDVDQKIRARRKSIEE